MLQKEGTLFRGLYTPAGTLKDGKTQSALQLPQNAAQIRLAHV